MQQLLKKKRVSPWPENLSCQLHVHFLSNRETTPNRSYLLSYQIFSIPLEALHIVTIYRTCTHMYTFTGIISVIQCMVEGILKF